MELDSGEKAFKPKEKGWRLIGGKGASWKYDQIIREICKFMSRASPICVHILVLYLQFF